jgi:peptide/nickel transport system permease protein
VEGDPVANLFRGRNLTEPQRAELTRQFGLDKSTGAQFVAYVEQTASLNLGRSYTTNRPVWEEIRSSLGPTIALVGISAVLSAFFGVLLGVAAAWRRRTRTDYSITAFSMGTYSTPDFWLGMLLLSFFAVSLGWFPVGGITDPASEAAGIGKLLDQAHHIFLPALTLTIAYLGEYAIVMRSSLLDTMREDYLTLARAKGLRDILVRNRHAVPNALLPVVALLAINLGLVMQGAIAVESIFSWPGIGLATYEALKGPDLPMLQGIFLVFSFTMIVFNLAADLLYGYLDPRVKAS